MCDQLLNEFSNDLDISDHKSVSSRLYESNAVRCCFFSSFDTGTPARHEALEEEVVGLL